MSRELREAINKALLALDGVDPADAPTARQVLEALWAQAMVEIFERGERIQAMARVNSQRQQAAWAASTPRSGSPGAHLSADFIASAIIATDVM